MEKLVIAGREFNSRLFLGTGKFNNNALMAEAIKASETEMVTVAMKRIELDKCPLAGTSFSQYLCSAIQK